MAGKTAKGEISTDVRRQHIDQWKSSGLAKDEYCAKNGVSMNQLNYWQKMLGGKRSKQVQKIPSFARVAVACAEVAPSVAPAPMRLVVGSAFVEILESADPVWAARIIAAIGGNA